MLAQTKSASVFFAGKDASVGGVAVQKNAPTAALGKRLLTAASLGEVLGAAAGQLGAGAGGLITLYYGGAQKERDAHKARRRAGRALPRGRGRVLLRRPARHRVLDVR